MTTQKYYLTVTLFGKFAAASPTATLPFRSDKVRALLAYLLMHHNTPVSRTELVYKLYSEYPEQTGRKNLNLTLTRLRESLVRVQANLGQHRPLLESDREQVLLHWYPEHQQADVLKFIALWESCTLHPHTALAYCNQCQPFLKQMIMLYRGPFLDDVQLKDSPDFNEWRLWQQETFQHQLLEILYAVTENALAAADYPQAITYARQQISLTPWQERPHRQLIRALLETGDFATAQSQFDTLKQILAAQFHIEPEPKTAALFEAISAPSQQSPSLAADSTALTPSPIMQQISRLLLDPVNRLITLVSSAESDDILPTPLFAQVFAHQFPDGVWHISLTDCDPARPETITQAIAAALNIPHSAVSTQPLLLDYLRPRRLLLILEAFTPFIRPSAPEDGVNLIMNILQTVPQVKIIVMAARPLRLQQEIVYIA